MKSNESDKFESNPEGGKLATGEPDALKGASPVRGRERGDVSEKTTRPAPIPQEIADAELERMKKGGKYYWLQRELKQHFHESGRPFYTPDLDKPYTLQCLRCNSHYTMDECDNCGNTVFEVGAGGGGLGIFCRACQSGVSNWTCPDCGTKNPASRTFYLLTKKGMCFIATAAYGSPLAPEVIILQRYRDEVLLKSRVGTAFVHAYYSVSPPLANIISKMHLLRGLTRTLILKPVLWLVQSESESTQMKIKEKQQRG